MGERNRAIAVALFAAGAFASIEAAATPSDFTVTYDISGGFGNYKWSIGVEGAAAVGNPALYLQRGRSYFFSITTTTIHPFWFDDALGTFSGSEHPYSGTGLSANPTTATASVTFDVPDDAPDTLYYQCGNHTEMHGTINVVVFRNGFD